MYPQSATITQPGAKLASPLPHVQKKKKKKNHTTRSTHKCTNRLKISTYTRAGRPAAKAAVSGDAAARKGKGRWTPGLQRDIRLVCMSNLATQLSVDQDHGSTIMDAAPCTLLSPRNKDLQTTHKPTATPPSSWQRKLHSVCHLQSSDIRKQQPKGFKARLNLGLCTCSSGTGAW
ncbi:uncharacterized protein LJ206_007480 isoform 1-T1 [Theristicus caerulescens]